MRLVNIALAVCLVSPLAAQGPVVPRPKEPPVTAPLRDREVAVTVEGCLRGSRLKINKSDSILPRLGASEYSLEGPKELMRQLQKEHDGHHDEIAGIAILPASQDDGDRIETKELGKRTRVVGGALSRNRQQSVPIVRLKVLSLTHLSNKCTS